MYEGFYKNGKSNGYGRLINLFGTIEIGNWVDGEFGIERERVLLTTMNGNKIFTYGEFESVSLDDTGLGKMTGLRVSEIKEETDDACDIN